jgi:acyl-CoA synthetase (AMP-forming)/AMP-acid ligase II
VFPDLLERLAGKTPSSAIVAVYGSSEAEPIAHQAMADISAAQWARMRAGGGILAGRPIDGLGLRIVDDEIVVTGAHVNKSYLGGFGDAENKLRLDGETWHRTGDAGCLDDAGNLWLHGRLSARAGDFYPFDVEVPARTWPGVRRAAMLPELVPPRIILEGIESSPGAWQSEANVLGNIRVVHGRVPFDRRHRSKIDYIALRRAFPSGRD